MVTFELDGVEYTLPVEWGSPKQNADDSRRTFGKHTNAPYTGQPYIPIIWYRREHNYANVFRCEEEAVTHYLSQPVPGVEYRLTSEGTGRGKWRWEW